MRGPPADRDLLRRTARRYRSCDRFTAIYVACKLRMDPVHPGVLALARDTPFGTVLDLGCGRGQLSVALLEAGMAGSVLGLDHDGDALAQLRIAASGLPLRAEREDFAAASSTLESADTVLLIDVLYQLPTEAQFALLRRAAQAARRTVVIRTSDPHAGWRSAVASTMERLGRCFWPTFGARSNPLPLAALADALAGCGFATTIAPCAQGTPLAGMLLVGRRATPPLACAAP